MTYLDQLLERNIHFAEQQTAAKSAFPSLPQALPHVKAVLIGCADMRVDPALILGLQLGEVVVMRNIGGRITPGLLQQLGLLGRIGQVAGETPGGGGEFHLIVLHHTDCGITRLTGDPGLISAYFGVQEADLRQRAVNDPRAAVAYDVATLRATPGLPATWLLSGLVYNTSNGHVEVVAPPAPIQS